MKYLMKVGDQLDLQVSYDGGAVDGVTYNAPDNFDNKVWVTASGIVEALGVGEGVVHVLSGGAIVGTIVFEVLTEAAYVAQQGIRDGSKALNVDVDEVPTAPAFTLVTGGTVVSSGGATRPPEYAFDGIDASVGNPPATYWDSAQYLDGVTQSYIGKVFSSPKQIKKIDIQWLTAPTEVDVCVSNSGAPETVIATIPVFYDDVVGNFAAGVVTAYQEVILPSYTAATSIFLRPKTSTPVPGTYYATQGSTHIDRFRLWEVKFYE